MIKSVISHPVRRSYASSVAGGQSSVIRKVFTQTTNKLAWGFTLIEILVVISIIGVLASLALVSFAGTQKQARDTQRKNDLKQYQTSLENFANNNSSLYPSEPVIIFPRQPHSVWIWGFLVAQPILKMEQFIAIIIKVTAATREW